MKLDPYFENVEVDFEKFLGPDCHHQKPRSSFRHSSLSLTKSTDLVTAGLTGLSGTDAYSSVSFINSQMVYLFKGPRGGVTGRDCCSSRPPVP